tara:strand:- start:784 stop:1518 length:735 start_codon:yes stop_codon:yes gene_type:complete
MAYSFNVNKALQESGYKGQFKDSLKTVLKEINKDPNISTIQEAAYLLATAEVESGYSLQRWEADYLCSDNAGKNMKGRSYKELPNNSPCTRALDYYRSTNGKSNYYNKGTDKRGLPYFGRGLIQLTGQANYETYGKLINVNLVNDADKALTPKNSYKIASTYLNRKRGSAKKSVYDYVRQGDFATARARVKGSSSGWENVKKTYDKWLKILQNNQTSTNLKPILVIGGVALVTGLIMFLVLRKR